MTACMDNTFLPCVQSLILIDFFACGVGVENKGSSVFHACVMHDPGQRNQFY